MGTGRVDIGGVELGLKNKKGIVWTEETWAVDAKDMEYEECKAGTVGERSGVEVLQFNCWGSDMETSGRQNAPLSCAVTSTLDSERRDESDSKVGAFPNMLGLEGLEEAMRYDAWHCGGVGDLVTGKGDDVVVGETMLHTLASREVILEMLLRTPSYGFARFRASPLDSFAFDCLRLDPGAFKSAAPGRFQSTSVAAKPLGGVFKLGL